jgi:hypothetical protein
MKTTTRSEAANKAWDTRLANQRKAEIERFKTAEVRKNAAKKAWKTMRAEQKRLTAIAKKAWATRRKNGNG